MKQMNLTATKLQSPNLAFDCVMKYNIIFTGETTLLAIYSATHF